jgi:hypothetical protein
MSPQDNMLEVWLSSFSLGRRVGDEGSAFRLHLCKL